MGDKPILFSGPMVKAILEGRKTMTRRVLKPQPINPRPTEMGHWADFQGSITKITYTPGDLLWVRENGWEAPELSERDLRDGADTWPKYAYDADDEWEPEWLKGARYKRRPSIHMPRWASRITLRVTAVKVERLQEISEDDAKAEGVEKPILAHWSALPFKSAFRGIWLDLHGPGAWDANPFVAAYSFERVKP